MMNCLPMTLFRRFHVALRVLLIMTVFTVLPAPAQTGAKRGVDVTAERHYHVLLDNSSVRVFRLELPPGQGSDLHWHDYDFMTVTLEDSTVSELIMQPATVEDARAHVLSQGRMATYELKKDFGAAWRTPAGIVHTFSNKTDKPYRNVTFEMKHGGDTVADGEALILRQGESATRDWRDSDHLVIAMNDLEMSDSAAAKQDSIRLKMGDAIWVPRGSSHTFANLGSKVALATSFEFK